MERRDFIGGILALALAPFAAKHAPALEAVAEEVAEPAALFPWTPVTSTMRVDYEHLSEFERDFFKRAQNTEGAYHDVPLAWRHDDDLYMLYPRTTDR